MVTALPAAGPVLLQVRQVDKAFGGAAALSGVDLTIVEGEVHALLGANGAGKSTLIKIIAGIHAADGGDLAWRGEPLVVRSLHESMAAGIAVMFQQLNVVEDLTVGEYLTLGRERSRFGVLDRRHGMQEARSALAGIGIDLDVTRPAATLSVAERELVEIARAVSLDARLVIMDEPTASLGDAEVERLFEVIRALRVNGVAVVYVSHKLDEVLAITDRCTVLRDGRNAGSIDTADATKDRLLEMMVGRHVLTVAAPRPPVTTEPMLEIQDVSTATGLRAVNLTVCAGEIVGVYGLMGAGRTELLRAVYGLDPLTSGRVRLGGTDFAPRSTHSAVRAGVGLVPEDRVREAMIPDESVAGNLTLSAPWRVVRRGVFRRSAEREIARDTVSAVGIKTPGVLAPITALSGGNQQKVVLGRWLVAGTRMLLLDDPTVGVDVAAKADIYALVKSMTADGTSVLICSSELEELLLLADRIAIMHRGEIVTVVDRSHADVETLIRQSIVGQTPAGTSTSAGTAHSTAPTTITDRTESPA